MSTRCVQFWSNVFVRSCHRHLANKHRPKLFLSNPPMMKQFTTNSLRCQRYEALNVDALMRKANERIGKGTSHLTSSQLRQLLSRIEEEQRELKELETMGRDNKELRDMATADADNLKMSLDQLGGELLEVLLSTEEDPMDSSDGLVLEVAAGVGGQEAMLFTEELFRMYESFAAFNGWNFEVLSYGETELGGVRYASGSVTGKRAYRLLKYEAGVHRVQRIPKTERAGRVHTSTSSVAILPLPTEIQVEINAADIRIETKRASGAGGQHVNKTESAVRLVHIPSGISIDSQTQRSQIQNKASAMTMLRARLYERQVQEQRSNIRSTRKLQIGNSQRNEKIRTYNFPQDRVTDHRIGLTVHNIEGILGGEVALENLLSNLDEYDRKERINAVLS